MLRLLSQHWKCSALCGALIGLAPLVYAGGPSEDEAQSLAARARPGSNIRSPTERRSWRPSLTANQQLLSCMLDWPGQVQRYLVTCSGTPHVDVKLADCCNPGDHWQVTVKVWDPKPHEAIESTSGVNNDFSMPARVFNYSNARDLTALIECSYLHGLNVFPAEADILVETGGSSPCTVQDMGTSAALERGR